MNVTSSKLADQFNLQHKGNPLTLKGMTGLKFPLEHFLILIEKFQPQTEEALQKGNCFLIPEQIEEEVAQRIHSSKTLLISKKIRMDFIRLLDFFNPYQGFSKVTSLQTFTNDFFTHQEKLKNEMGLELGEGVSIAPGTMVGENVKIGNRVKLMGNNYIGHQVEIGDDVVIFPNTVILDGTVIGKNSLIHSGVVLGSDGFSYEPTPQGNLKIPQIGNVVIGENVEIGANTTIDRATINHTVIGNRVKIDNLVQIGHNVIVGDDTVLVSQVGIAGSTTVGKQCVFGGQVGLADHLVIGDQVRITAKSGVAMKKVPDKTILAGIPAVELREHARMITKLRSLIKK